MHNDKWWRGLCALGLIAVPHIDAEAQAPVENERNNNAEKPNIIFILADDLGYGDLSCYGNRHVETPYIDRLAETGTRFTQCYAGSAVSSPSRCSLMTGRNTGNTTIRDNFAQAGGIEGKKGEQTIRRMHLLPNDTTIAAVLGAGGYRTCLVNKWHLDGFNPEATPLNRGFDEFYGWLISTSYSNDPYYYPYWRFDNDSLGHVEENANGRHIRHNTDISTDDAIAFLRRNRENPFFLYLAYDAPHEPYNIDDTHWYDDEESWEPNTKRYASLITHMDQAIGRLLAELDTLGLRENTLIIFASDNGAAKQAPLATVECNGNLRGIKGQLYEGGIRVPFIVNWPGHVPVRQLDNLIYFPDVMPTLAAVAGATEYLPSRRDGIDLWPLILGGQLDTDNRLLYWEFPGKQRAARRGDWKVVSVKKNAPLELYNLREDETESNNLAEKYPEKVADFERQMQQVRTPSPYWPLPEEQPAKE